MSDSNNVQANKTNGLAIAGFVVSLVSSLLCCGVFNIVSLVLSIVGLVQAKNYDGNGKGLAIAGIAVSAVFLVIGLVYLLLFGLGAFASVVEQSA